MRLEVEFGCFGDWYPSHVDRTRPLGRHSQNQNRIIVRPPGAGQCTDRFQYAAVRKNDHPAAGQGGMLRWDVQQFVSCRLKGDEAALHNHAMKSVDTVRRWPIICGWVVVRQQTTCTPKVAFFVCLQAVLINKRECVWSRRNDSEHAV